MTAPPPPIPDQKAGIFEAILRGLFVGIAAVDSNGRLLFANTHAAAQLGVSSEQLKPGMDFEDAPWPPSFRVLVNDVRRSGVPVQYRELPADAATARSYLISGGPLLLDGAEPGVVFGFLDSSDLMARNRAEETARQLTAFGKLAAGVAHRLRNPLTIMLGRAELLKRSAVTDEIRRSADIISHEAELIERTIAAFLDLATPFEFKPNRITARQIVDRALQSYRDTAGTTSLTIKVNVEDGGAVIHGDKERLGEALGNILLNAVESIEPSGNVQLQCNCDGKFVVFAVIDDGPGVRLKPGQDVFTPFFSQKRDGEGIGLTFAQKVAAVHGGTIEHQNLEAGGARFELRIPLAGRP